MNLIRPRTGKSGIAPLRISVIFLLLIIVRICGQGSTLYAQKDSLETTLIPLAEIATAAATDMQQTRDLMGQGVQVSTSFKMVPKVDSLEIGVMQLKELSDQVLESRLDDSYYSSLIMRWKRVESLAVPIQENLQKHLASVEEINTNLVSTLSRWDFTLNETEPALLTEDIISRINQASHYIDSVRNIVVDSLNSSLALQNRVTDLYLVIETYLPELEELRKMELGTSLLTKDDPIFNLKRGPDSLFVDSDRAFLLTMGIEDTKVYLEKEWPTMLLLLLFFFGFLIAFVILRRVQTPTEPGIDQAEWRSEKLLTKPAATALIFTMLLALHHCGTT